MSSTGPNILLIHSDQHRYDCVGANGHPVVRTPNLDRLAREGTRFTHAFTPVPICSAARASLLTGSWPTQHGCLTIPYCCETFQSARADLPVLTTLLAGAGYDIRWVGKFHNEVPGVPTDYGVREFVGTHGYRKYRLERGLPPTSGGLFGAVDVGVRAEDSSIAYQVDHALRMLRDAASAGNPFFLRWDPPEPHLPNHVPEEDAGLYPPGEIPPWPSFPDPLTGKPPAQRRTRQRWGTDDWGWERWQPIVSRYLATIDLLDRHIGRLLSELDRLGLAENTLVVYSTDHGDMCGGHGMMDKHYCMYDDILRVPLLVRFPGRVKPASACNALVSNEIDLARTLLSAAGVEVPPSFVGQDLLALAAGEQAPRSEVLVQYFGTQQGLYSSRALRTHDWKYIYNPSAFDELYHLPTDPGELTNRIDDAGCAEVLGRMRARMGDEMASLRDPLNPPLWTWPG